jgi:hypothetical protein
VQPVRKDHSNSRSRRTEGGRASRKVIELRRARVVALVLLLVAAALYVSPLRAFFAAQDSYFSQRSALSAVQATNRALHRQISGTVAAAPRRLTLGVRLSDLWRTLRE